MKRISLAVLAAVVTVTFCAPVLFAGTETGPKVAFHLTAPASKASFICTSNSPNGTSTPCSNYAVDGNLNTDYLVYVVVAQADTPAVSGGLSAVELGIQYDGDSGEGVDVSLWTLCADGLEFTNSGPRGEWPASGGGNRVTWLTCQTTRWNNEGIHAVVGAFAVYAYSADSLLATPNRNLLTGSALTIADCSGAETPLDTLSTIQKPLGLAGFGGVGCNPCTNTDCGPNVPVTPTTWGKIKNQYGR